MADQPTTMTLNIAPKTVSAVRNDKPADTESAARLKIASARKNKDKFVGLREKYDQVTAKREELRRELDVANEKLRRLNAENDLLLDAMHIVAYQQPTLVRYLPAPEADHAVTQDMGPAPIREQRIHEQPVRMNGDSDHQFEPDVQHADYSIRETNGHMP